MGSSYLAPSLTREALSAHRIGIVYWLVLIYTLTSGIPVGERLRSEEAKVPSTLWLTRRIQLALWGLREPRTNGVKLGLVREASSAGAAAPVQKQGHARCFLPPRPLPGWSTLALSGDLSSEKDCLQGSRAPDEVDSDVQLEIRRIQLGGLSGLH